MKVVEKDQILIGDKFFEVKTYTVQLETFGYFQDYKEIVDRYIGEQLKDGKIITSCMIISLLGFSPEVRQLAEKDQTELIGPLQLKQVFRDKGREDLIKLMCTLN